MCTVIFTESTSIIRHDDGDSSFGGFLVARSKIDFVAFVLILIVFPASLVAGQQPGPLTPQDEIKIDALISQLSLEQKINLIGGADGMFIRKEDAIGLPA